MANNVLFELDLSASTLANSLTTRADTYYLASIAAYGSPTETLYAAVWQPRPYADHPTQKFVPGLGAKDVGAVIAKEFAKGGFCATALVSVASATPLVKGVFELSPSSPCYSILFERSAGLPQLGGLSPSPPTTALLAQAIVAVPGNDGSFSLSGVTGNQAVVHLDFDYVTLTVPGTPFVFPVFCALVTASNPAIAGEPFRAWNLTDESILATGTAVWEGVETHRVMRQGWARPEVAVPVIASPNSTSFVPQVASLWNDSLLTHWPEDITDPSWDMGVQVRGPMPPSQVKATNAIMLAQGYQPYRVGAKGLGKAAALFITYARAFAPLNRTVVTLGPFDKTPTRVPAYEPHFTKAANPLNPNGPGAPSPAGSAKKLEIIKRNLPPGLRIPANYVPPPDPPSGTTGLEALRQRKQPSIPWNSTIHADTPQLDPATQAALNALDTTIIAMMIANGARAAQVTATKNGGLFLDRNYTFAEEGYPVTQSHHKMRMGSISKALTGMALIKSRCPNGDLSGLSKSMADVCDIHGAPNQEYINTATLEMMMRHRSGMQQDFLNAPFSDLIAVIALDTPPAKAGDARLYVKYTHEPDLFPNLPQNTIRVYDGSALRMLSELAGHDFTANRDWTAHEEGLRSNFWLFPRPNGAHDTETYRVVPELFPDDAATCLARWHVPAHDGALKTRTSTLANQGTALRPAAYAYNANWSGGAGGWAMSAPMLSRIGCGMDAVSDAPHLLNAKERAALWTPEKGAWLDPDLSVKNQGLVLIFDPPANEVNPYNTLQGQIDLFHDGSAEGCSTFWVYRTVFKSVDFMYTDEVETTYSIAILLNQQGPEPTLADTQSTLTSLQPFLGVGSLSEDLFKKLVPK